MRHGKRINHLSRTDAHRKAMLSNMAVSLILHKRINTTLAKAKALRTFVEPLITRSKEDTTHSRRMVFRYLQDKEAVNELFREVSVKVADRPGGYTRILKTGTRLGDNAEMCMIELVDYNENMLSSVEEQKEAAKKKTRRGGRRKTSSDTPETTTEAAEKISDETEKKAEVSNEAPAEEKPSADEQQADDKEKE
jgi:large subunit ribosomal protein L17